MTDIVERLRNVAVLEWCEPMCVEAADEIERLRAALRDIASGRYSNMMLPTHPPQDPAVVRARDALIGS